METEEPIKNMKRRLTALKESSDCLKFIYLAHPQDRESSLLSRFFCTGRLVLQDKWNQNSAQSEK